MIIVGGGGLFLLVFFALLVIVPIALFRAVTRRPVSHRGYAPYLEGPYAGGPYGGGQPRGWDVPQEPALPSVSPADVSSLRDRLGQDVSTLDPGSDPVARQALADASERYSTCSTLLERAGSDAQLRTAWLAAVEGLTASRVVRARLGLDPGPDIPLPPSGPQLQGPSRVAVGGRTHVGGPAYEPGRPHWFPGGAYDGRYVPGGWYDRPFWPSSLILGGLGGFALGSLAAGAMFGDDLAYADGIYDGGLDGGYDGGGFDDSGGGWGDGGDGGGFGGFGGGGDWGGGGGDIGGGDIGGGGDW